jgi:acyl carrier protein
MDIEQRVLRLVSEERGVELTKLNLSDRLNVDLGMDGDDAAEFFEKFEAEFNVDCSELQSHWSDYFGPEGVMGPPSAAFLVASAVIGVIIAIFLPGFYGFAGFLAFLAICLVVLFTWAQINTVRERRNPTSPQITIAQLIEAATTNRLIL